VGASILSPQLFEAFPPPLWDGYVTWHCRRRTTFQWQCREFTSGTAFRFRAEIIA
jgi:hypothetical protein